MNPNAKAFVLKAFVFNPSYPSFIPPSLPNPPKTSLFDALPDDFIVSILIEWLYIQDLARLDSALCHRKTRTLFLGLLGSEHPGIKSVAARKRFDIRSGVVQWLESRGISMNEISFCGDIDLSSPFLPKIGGTLQSLNIDFCKKITDAGVVLIVENCSNLQSLSLDSSLITDIGLGFLATRCSNLQYLHLALCDKITDIGVGLIAAGCSNLQFLQLGYCNKITDTGLELIAAGCSNLQHLQLGYCDKITDIGVGFIAENCSKLQFLGLALCDKITDIGVGFIAAGCSTLQHLHLYGCNKITDIGLRLIAESCSSNLQSLDLTLCKEITYAGIVLIVENCTNLQSLNLYCCSQIWSDPRWSGSYLCGCEEITSGKAQAIREGKRIAIYMYI